MWPIKKDRIGQHLVACLLLLGVAIYAGLFSWVGLIIENDSIIYIRGALNMHDGKGFTLAGKYISHFPVGLSFVYYGLMQVFPGTIFSLAIGLHLALLLGLGFGMISIMRQWQFQPIVQGITLFAFLFSVPVAETTTRFLSDFPFMCMLMLSILLFLRHLKTPASMGYLWALGFVLGITYLVRFATLGFLGAYLLLPFVLWPNEFKQHFRKSLALLIPFLLIMLGNKAYVEWKYHSVSVDRVLAWHPMTGSALIGFPQTLLSWAINYNMLSKHTAFVTGIMLLGIVLAIWGMKKKKVLSNQWTTSVLMHQQLAWRAFATITLYYCLFLIVSISLFDAWTPINTRLLSPLAIIVYLGLGHLLQEAYKQSKYPRLCIGLSVALVVLMSASTIKLMVKGRSRIPSGYNSPYWNTIGQAIANNQDGTWLTPECSVYSNGIAFFALQNDREVIDIPYKYSPITHRENPQCMQELKQLTESIRQGKARLVFFKQLPAPPFKLSEADLMACFADRTQFNVQLFEGGFVVVGIGQKKMN